MRGSVQLCNQATPLPQTYNNYGCDIAVMPPFKSIKARLHSPMVAYIERFAVGEFYTLRYTKEPNDR